MIVTTASIMSAVYFYVELGRVETSSQTAAVASANELKEVVAKVGRLVILPEGEEPTLATVAEPDKLRDQPFFAKAKKGDKVLVYNKAQRAILYDPVQDKIVEIAPIAKTN